ncbi:prepilin-type N-terminal cleavage/methylation domain-containing protein [Luminiphilus sp.]|nr:prepilin-type N-terminal cleavage/methylation domain-containing protein [Luminiphilus sp.]
MLTRRTQQGMSLAELMISLVVSSFIVLAAATHYTITYRTTLLAQKTSARTDQFTHVEHVISSALREAGFLYSMDNLILHLTDTADMSGSTLETYVKNLHTESNCILVTIGTDSTPYQQLGFKLNNGVIETLSGSSLSCSSGSWAPISASTTLSFETFSVSVSGSPSYYNADDPDESSLTYNDCFGGTRSTNCAVTQLWDVTLCALPPDSSGGTCNDLTTPYYSSLLIAPRNPILTGATSN